MTEKLPLLTPDASRSAKTMARCHDRLATRRRNIEARTRRRRLSSLGTEGLVVAGLCFLYLLGMAADLLALAARR